MTLCFYTFGNHPFACHFIIDPNMFTHSLTHSLSLTHTYPPPLHPHTHTPTLHFFQDAPVSQPATSAVSLQTVLHAPPKLTSSVPATSALRIATLDVGQLFGLEREVFHKKKGGYQSFATYKKNKDMQGLSKGTMGPYSFERFHRRLLAAYAISGASCVRVAGLTKVISTKEDAFAKSIRQKRENAAAAPAAPVAAGAAEEVVEEVEDPDAGWEHEVAAMPTNAKDGIAILFTHRDNIKAGMTRDALNHKVVSHGIHCETVTTVCQSTVLTASIDDILAALTADERKQLIVTVNRVHQLHDDRFHEMTQVCGVDSVTNPNMRNQMRPN
jgi:hypothetical protein